MVVDCEHVKQDSPGSTRLGYTSFFDYIAPVLSPLLRLHLIVYLQVQIPKPRLSQGKDGTDGCESTSQTIRHYMR